MANISCGVPQGSILGPLLFLIDVNDLKSSSKILNPIMFADDTNLFYSHKNIKSLFDMMNKELKHISEWFRPIQVIIECQHNAIYILSQT